MKQTKPAKKVEKPKRPTDPVSRLRELVGAATDRAIDLLVHGDRLMFRKPGLAIYRRRDGSFRIVEAAGYHGPNPEAYVLALAERELEREALDQIERMTDEARRGLLHEHEGITSAPRGSLE